MSTLTVSNISDSTTTVGTNYILSGSSRAWININASSTVTITNSFNFSSVTDEATGKFDTSLTNAMANANYAGVCGPFESNSNTSIIAVAIDTTLSTASTVMVRVNTNSAGGWDAEFNCVSLLGDLA